MDLYLLRTHVEILLTHCLPELVHFRIYFELLSLTYRKICVFTPIFGPKRGLGYPKYVVYGFVFIENPCGNIANSLPTRICPFPNLFLTFSFKGVLRSFSSSRYVGEPIVCERTQKTASKNLFSFLRYRRRNIPEYNDCLNCVHHLNMMTSEMKNFFLFLQ